MDIGDAVTMTTPRWSIAKLATLSAVQFCRLVASHALHLRRDRLGERYTIDQGGTYAIFRETVSEAEADAPSVVLVIGFRLRALRSYPLPHWLFQRLCILTTPLWSGFSGFRVKLWMVDPVSKNYLGIYDWAGAENAQVYVQALIRVLCPLSTCGSVWYRLYPGQELDAYLRTRKYGRPLTNAIGEDERLAQESDPYQSPHDESVSAAPTGSARCSG